jgi:hypothetical protein
VFPRAEAQGYTVDGQWRTAPNLQSCAKWRGISNPLRDQRTLTLALPGALYFHASMWKLLRRKVRYYLQYVPFTRNSILWALAIGLLYYLLYAPQRVQMGKRPADDLDQTANNLQPFILLMSKLALWLVVGLIALSVLSSIFAWLYYLWLKHKKGNVLELRFATEPGKRGNHRVFLNATLPGVFRPLLGFVSARLYYDDYQLSGKFPLLGNRRRPGKILRYGISAHSRLELPDIREYRLRGGFVYFEDMLRLFSFVAEQPAGGSFHQMPRLGNGPDDDVNPRKTEQLDVRINQMRRVEGEPFSYKDFEPGDDVRRIVWKVYARSRDLVVRIPERFEPYASHLYMYASFHSDMNAAWTENEYGKEMLNYYKNQIWTVYDTLAKKGFELRYISDQPVHVAEAGDASERTAKIISGSDWQKDKEVSDYFNLRQGTVLCVSSFCSLHDLNRLIDAAEPGTVVYFVKLTNRFRQFVAWTWLKRLIFLPPKDRFNRLRGRWTFSPLRPGLRRRERAIEAALKKSSLTWHSL